jgi:secretion/DNA translocation related TadE-like protein
VRRSGPRDDRGSATLPALACLGVLLLLGAALGVAAAMVTAHRAAQSAADLAALAAAGAIGTAAGAPAGGPCVAGAAVAAANGARLTGCEIEGRTALVRVAVTGPHWLGQDADLEAAARAGPAQG